MKEKLKREYSIEEQAALLRRYNIIDWLDFGLVVLIGLYYFRMFQEDMEVTPDNIVEVINTPISLVGFILCLASLFVCISAVITAIKVWRSGANSSKVRLTIRLVLWGFWIPFDLLIIVTTLGGLI